MIDEHGVGQAFGIIEASWVGGVAPLRLDARPSNRIAVTFEIKLADECRVLGIAVLAVARGVACVSAGGQAGYVRKSVPYGRAFAVHVPRAFHLLGGGGGAPQEVGRK